MRRAGPAVAIAVLVVGWTVLGATPGFAASMGTSTSKAMSAFTPAASTGSPSVIAYDNFTATSGSAIAGTTTDGGNKTWAQRGGTWTTSSNKAKSTSASPSQLYVNAGASDHAVEATVRHGSGQWQAQLIVDSNAGGTDQLVADYTKASTTATLTLTKWVGGSSTLLSTVTGLTIATSVVVRLSTTATGVTVWTGGTQRISYSLSAGEQSTFKDGAHTYAGIGTYSDSSTTLDTFHLDG